MITLSHLAFGLLAVFALIGFATVVGLFILVVWFATTTDVEGSLDAMMHADLAPESRPPLPAVQMSHRAEPWQDHQ